MFTLVVLSVVLILLVMGISPVLQGCYTMKTITEHNFYDETFPTECYSLLPGALLGAGQTENR